MSVGCKINRKRELAIAALLTERTHAVAAARAGISEATLQRWLKYPPHLIAKLERVGANSLRKFGYLA